MLTNSIGMEFVLIPAGMFMMGSPDSDADAYDAEKPAHRVIISQPFYLGKYPVTNRQYAAFLKQEWRQEVPDKSLGGYHASRPGTRAIIRWWASAGTRAGPTVTGCLGRRGSVIACPPRLSGKKRPAAQQVGAIPGGMRVDAAAITAPRVLCRSAPIQKALASTAVVICWGTCRNGPAPSGAVTPIKMPFPIRIVLTMAGKIRGGAAAACGVPYPSRWVLPRRVLYTAL